MCGIVGYIGPREAQDVLLSGLAKLEYRGYDSAGIAVLADHTITVEKRKGELANLEQALADHPLAGHVGIGHTRWATHGQPSDKNAHPHLGPEGKIAVVHNGIIENYQSLKETYLKDHTFKSETDTEVVAHLIELFYDGDLFAAVQRALAVITGSYALVVMAVDEPDRIIATRKNSPLVIGLGDGETIIASDVPAMLAYTRRCIYLDSGEIAQVYADHVDVTDLAGTEQHLMVDEIQWDAQSAEKGGYDHFMIKEIFEQIETFGSVLAGRIEEDHVVLDDINIDKATIEKWHQIYIVACGTAYHAGLVGKTILEKTLKIPVFVEVASEFRYREPMLDENTLVIVISQSGETADTLEGAREAKAAGASVLAITNVVGSSIARESDMVVYLWAGPEISVASTKAYTSMLIALYLIGFYFGDVSGRVDEAEMQTMLRALEALPEQAEEILAPENIDRIKAIAAEYKDAKDLFYIAVQGSLLPFVAQKLAMIDEGGNVFKTFTDYVDESPVNFIQFRIEPDHDWCGKRVMDITLPPGSLLVSLSRGEEEMLPKGGTVLQEGDVLVLCALEEGDTPNLSLVETVLEKEDFTPGMTLGDLPPRPHSLIVLIQRDHRYIIPDGGTRLQEGDKLLIAVNEDALHPGRKAAKHAVFG